MIAFNHADIDCLLEKLKQEVKFSHTERDISYEHII
jgi:hypothetical protein